MIRLLRAAGFSLLLLGSLFSDPAPTAAEEPKDDPAEFQRAFESHVRPFLKSYCFKCHGPSQQKAERRFDMLDGRFGNDEDLVDYQDVLDQLNLAEMPPPKAEQPTAEARRLAVDWLTRRIAEYHQQRQGAHRQTVLRRLNAREYRNSLRDLLQLNLVMFDPADGFPQDQTREQLDNVGETLVMSGHLLSRYLASARRAVEKALGPRRKPESRIWRFDDGFRQQPEIDQVHRKSNRFAHMTLYEVVGADKPEGAYGPILAFAEGVPYDGWYRIKFQAEALHRRHPYDAALFGTDPDEPLKLGIVPGRKDAGELHLHQPIEPLLAELPLSDEARTYETRVWLDQGFTPRFTFRNGPIDVRNLYAKLLRAYPDQFPERKNNGIVEARYNAITQGKLPQIRLDDFEIEGPLFDEWPTASQRLLLGEECATILATGAMTPEQTRRQLTRFASRAYRRPATADEIERLLRLAEARQAEGRDALDAFGEALQAVLCSPNFLFLDEPGDERLSDHALASRLSYFLWASPPDDVLLGLAGEGRLGEVAVLRGQVKRLLEDPKSDAFIAGFLDSWLTLRELGATPPDRGAFREYYQYELGQAMRRETELFTRCMIAENLDVVRFLDADFTFVNKRLAELYRMPPPANAGFQRVTLEDKRRGGLLGQASVLTVTANGIDTSPVVRGVWLLENLLGTPPSPPPPDVEPLDPDVRGARSIREQLSKHRELPSCYECHRKIDPLGFALENFDAIGRWRERYDRRTPIDATGELPSGEAFDDVVGLKKLLAQRREPFMRALTRKTLAYAIGRPLEGADRPEVERIVGELEERGGGFADLLELVVLSKTFATP